MVKWINQPNEREQINFVNFKEAGEEFTGVLEKIIPNVGKFKNNNLFLFRGDDGKLYGIMGTKALNDVLPDLIGKKVILVYEGKARTKKGTDFVLFRIGIDENYEPYEYVTDLDIQ